MSEINDPLAGSHGLTFTPFHLIVLLFASLALVMPQLGLPPHLQAVVGMWRRAMVLLVIGLILYNFISAQLRASQARTNKLIEKVKLEKDIEARSLFRKQPNAWENQTSHPSQFLTTRDGKPRLFPFPLGKAGGNSLKGELWWEAGNSAHVGHFNQKETPEAREELRREMEDQDEERQKKSKKAMERYEDNRKKWAKRLSHIKVEVHRKAAVVLLAVTIYHILATEFVAMLKPKAEDEEDDRRAIGRRKVPREPGVALTYIYEPTKGGGVKEAGSIPVKAPSNRLLTSTDSRFAS